MNLRSFIQIENSLGEVYLHINNGGVTFEIGEDRHGFPVIRVASTHFGHLTGLLELSLTQERLNKLSGLLKAACEHKFKGDSTTSARDFGCF